MNRILEILADGEFHSGESLGRALGVSRAAIWKQVGRLEGMGLTVHSVKGKGYRLVEGPELLSEQKIRAALGIEAAKIFPAITVKSEVASTNDEVKAAGAAAAPLVCFAETQHAGRGRRGRHWVSPYGSNIYMSLSWEFPELSGSLDGLSLCVGVAVASAVRGLGIETVGLKWPNDLVYERQKLAGILLEMEGELAGPMWVIIGIGINVAMTRAEGVDIDQDWISLSEIAASKISRNQLAAQVLTELSQVLPKFQSEGFVGFRDKWGAFDVLNGAPVVLSMANRKINGVARGVTAEGELLIENELGVHPYRAGEVSVRVEQ